ncbi:MAG: HEPN domain-containing protein [Candidatus Micrarchaeota archaeon]
MDSRFKRCLEERKLVRMSVQLDLVKKELDEAENDLISAEKSLVEDNPKWATVQAYYSMFHVAKALVLSKGYREKSHICLSIALKSLFVDKLEQRHYEHFRDCMGLRMDADYGSVYSSETARDVIVWAREFLVVAKKILKL